MGRWHRGTAERLNILLTSSQDQTFTVWRGKGGARPVTEWPQELTSPSCEGISGICSDTLISFRMQVIPFAVREGMEQFPRVLCLPGIPGRRAPLTACRTWLRVGIHCCAQQGRPPLNKDHSKESLSSLRYITLPSQSHLSSQGAEPSTGEPQLSAGLSHPPKSHFSIWSSLCTSQDKFSTKKSWQNLFA